jgi:hypothetical protein
VLRFRIVVESFLLLIVFCCVLVAAFRDVFSCCFFCVLWHAYKCSEVLLTENTQLPSDVYSWTFVRTQTLLERGGSCAGRVKFYLALFFFVLCGSQRVYVRPFIICAAFAVHASPGPGCCYCTLAVAGLSRSAGGNFPQQPAQENVYRSLLVRSEVSERTYSGVRREGDSSER